MSTALGLAALLALVAQPESEAPVAQLTKLPLLVKFVDAPYPPQALEARRQGAVLLQIDIDDEGKVERVALLESAGAEFDEAAMNAAAGFEFTPAEAGELGPVPVRITYRYAFTLAATPVDTASAAASAPDVRTAAPVNFTGRVLEGGARRPVQFAEVEIVVPSTATTTFAGVDTSTETDTLGRFSLRGIPAGQHKVRIKAPFFETLEQYEVIAEGEVLEVLYFATRLSKNPYEVIVRAKAPRKEVARRTLQLEEIRRVPGTQGDAIRVVQNLPGVARTPFGLGLLIVRGAPPQDTGVFIDGHRVPLLFHFGGIGGVTSVIHSSILEQINFLPGGFGPEYGLVSAGIVELETRRPKTDRVHGEAQIDTLALVPVNVSVFVEGPVTSNPKHGSFFFSLRRSSIDGVFAALLELADADFSLAPRYYDYQLRYDVPIGDDGKRNLSFFAYGSDDELLLLGAGNLGGNASSADSTQSRSFFHRFNPKFEYRASDDSKFEISPIFGFDYTNTEIPGSGGSGTQFKLEARNLHAGVRVVGETRLADWAKIEVGGDVLYFYFDNEAVVPVFAPIRDFPSPVLDDAPTRSDVVTIPVTAASLWTEVELTPLPGLTLWPGLRVQLLDYFAKDQLGVDPRLVEGRTLAAIDPRLTARYDPFESFGVKAQIGLYRQPALPPQIFLNADLPFQTTEQISGGIEWEIIDRLSLDVQGFYRHGRQVPFFTNRTEVVDGKIRPVGFLPPGENRSFGMEMLLRINKRWGLFGWLAYTLSRSEIKTRGNPYRQNFFFDQTHNINLVAVYELSLNWHVGTRFRYVTGGGLPNTVDRWYDADADSYFRDIDGLTRAPAFHQLDIYVEKRWAFDEWYFEAYLDLQNVYNHTNTELFAPTFDFKDTVAIPGLPILPTLGVKGVF